MNDTLMSDYRGYWAPHSSSVDFCEPNYLLTSYIAEPFNAFSSFFIAYLGLYGILYCNQLKDYRFDFMFGLLMFIGLGSVALHTTLHWLPQSFDEVPMLWFNMMLLYGFWRDDYCDNSVDKVAVFFGLVTGAQTFIYYAMRSWYAAFLAAETLSTLAITILNIKRVFFTEYPNPLLKSLLFHIWCQLNVAFFGVGFALWLIDMNLCSILLPYYAPFYGATLHVIWHMASAYGAYFQIMLLIALRMDIMGLKPRLQWSLYAPPILVGDDGVKKKQT